MDSRCLGVNVTRKKRKRGGPAGRRRASETLERRGRARRGVGFVLLVNFAIFAALLGLLELGARLFFPRDMRAVFDDPDMFVRGRPFVSHHPERGFALVPGFDGPNCRINADGFRGPDLPAEREQLVWVVALGESSTFGWRVGDGEAWPAQLGNALDPGAIRVVNAGVPSYTSAQTWLYLQQLLDTLEPDVVLVNIGFNDALYSCIDNWMPEFLVRQQPARWRQLLLRSSGLYRALVLSPTRDATTPEVKNQAAIDHYASNLEKMIRACQERGVAIVVVHSPMCGTLVPEEGMKIGPRTVSRDFFVELLGDFAGTVDEVGARHDVPVVTHRLSLAESAPDSLFLDPAHPTADGYRLLAADVASVLADLDVVATASAHQK
jgi:lysophospholipase L1-like esterase